MAAGRFTTLALVAALLCAVARPALAAPVCMSTMSPHKVRLSFRFAPECRMRRAIVFELGRLEAERFGPEPALLAFDGHRIDPRAIVAGRHAISVCSGPIAPASIRLFATDDAGLEVFYSTDLSDLRAATACPARHRMRVAATGAPLAWPDELRASLGDRRPTRAARWQPMDEASRELLESIQDQTR